MLDEMVDVVDWLKLWMMVVNIMINLNYMINNTEYDQSNLNQPFHNNQQSTIIIHQSQSSHHKIGMGEIRSVKDDSWERKKTHLRRTRFVRFD